MQKKIQRRQADYPSLTSTDNPVLIRVLAHRGVSTNEAVDYNFQRLLTPDKLHGLERAVSILYEAFQNQLRVCIVGDFDADGATSTALCIKILRAMGLRYCDFIVPNRFEYGYGLTPEIVELALEKKPDILLTVDNGISSVDGVAAARARGLRVIVTDHHLPGDTLPQADAIVNPNQNACGFPSKNLAGVGVAFYLLSALRSYLEEQGWFVAQNIARPNLAEYLDLVALGTVADVVNLDENNRILVSQGLRRIRAAKCCPGISALLRVAKRNLVTVTANDLGFALGPRLNAAGRLDDMSVGIQCLLAESSYEAERLAQQLDDLNRERRAIEAGMQTEAFAVLQTWRDDDVPNRFGICLFDNSWHEGVIGILASRIKEKMHRPVIVLAPGLNGQLKGSGRSIPGVHLRDVLDEIATLNPGLLHKFGGHAMAAGLSIADENLSRFVEEFDRVVAKSLGHTHPEAELLTDGELLPEEISLETAFALRNAGPWGQGFPEPTFDGVFTVIQRRVLQGRHLKLSVTPGTWSGLLLDAIYFNFDIEDPLPEDEFSVHLVYKLDVNEFRGESNVQLLVEYMQILDVNSA